MKLAVRLQRIFKLIIEELVSGYAVLVIYFPFHRSGVWLRKRYWKKVLRTCDYPSIGFGARIYCPNLIEVGASFILSDHAVVSPGDSHGIYIGNYVGIAKGCFLRAANHCFDQLDVPWQQQGHECKRVFYREKEYSIIIEDDVLIGVNCVILSGAHIKKGSVIAASSVVSGVIPEYSVVVGNSGRVVADRKKRASLTTLAKQKAI